MPSQRYNAPIRKVGQRFVVAVMRDLHRVRNRVLNLERFIVFKTVI